MQAGVLQSISSHPCARSGGEVHLPGAAESQSRSRKLALFLLGSLLADFWRPSTRAPGEWHCVAG